MSFTKQYLSETVRIVGELDTAAMERIVKLLKRTFLRGGRLFVLGVGGSAANASHAVNDFRKIVGLEAYAPTDNVSELTARANDEGWASVFEGWLRVSRLRKEDCVLVFSVGGGNEHISPNLVKALQFAKSKRAGIAGVVSGDGGYTAKVADVCVIIQTKGSAYRTMHSEEIQGVVWHLLVSHPDLRGLKR